MQDKNLIMMLLIIVLLYIILNNKNKNYYRKDHKKHSKKHSKKHNKKHNKLINDKKDYIMKELVKLKDKTQLNSKKIYLISAYSSTINNSFDKQFESCPIKLYSINENNIKNNDIIKTNFIDNNKKLKSSLKVSHLANLDNLDNDLFLINQINSSKNNSVAFLDNSQHLKSNKKINDRLLSTKHEELTNNFGNKIRYEINSKNDYSLA
jgi:hypothetical protein